MAFVVAAELAEDGHQATREQVVFLRQVLHQVGAQVRCIELGRVLFERVVKLFPRLRIPNRLEAADAECFTPCLAIQLGNQRFERLLKARTEGHGVFADHRRSFCSLFDAATGLAQMSDSLVTVADHFGDGGRKA